MFVAGVPYLGAIRRNVDLVRRYESRRRPDYLWSALRDQSASA